ncbi:short chain dehydrogenase [compost metagenome]
MGGLDVLVNNAGVSGPTAPVEQLEPDEWDKVMQINLKVPSTLRAWPSLRSNVRYTPQSLTCLLLRGDWATQIAPPTRPVNEG